MNNFYIIIFFVFALIACDAFADSNRIGNSDANGYAFINRRLNSYNEEIPINLIFSTDPKINFETCFGAYWYIPIMSTRVFDSGNGYITWITPTKRRIFFKKEGNKKLTDLGNGWACIQNKNSITISSLNGSTFYIYKSGRLHSMQVNNNLYKFYYSQGKLAKIQRNNELYASLSYAKGYVSFIHLPLVSRKYEFKYADTSINESPLLVKILQNDKSIYELKYSRGTVEKDNNIYFDDKVNVNIPTGIYKIDVATSISIPTPTPFNQWIEWDSATGILAKDSSGIYCIGSYTKNNNISYVVYKSIYYDYPEIAIMDYGNAIQIQQNPRDGVMTKTSYIGAPGKSYMKIRKKEVKSNKSDKWDFVFSMIYDNNGRAIREINNKNEIIEWRYPNDKDNGIYSEIVNGITVKSKEFKSGKMIREMRLLNGDVYELFYLDKGYLVTKNGKKVEM